MRNFELQDYSKVARSTWLDNLCSVKEAEELNNYLYYDDKLTVENASLLSDL